MASPPQEGSFVVCRAALLALTFALATSVAARAENGGGAPHGGVVAAGTGALEDSWDGAGGRSGESAQPLQQRRYYPVPRRDAREGFLFSFGLGGGSVRFSNPDFLRTGALNFGLRMGYGFSDRFQLFGDFSADAGFYSGNRQLTNWLVTLRGQTVLIGDTAGNGLNLNLGFGLGGVTYDAGCCEISSAAAPALVGGLSYDARVGRFFALSPELYFSYHKVPNGPGLADDQIWAAGLRLNFLWYSPVY